MSTYSFLNVQATLAGDGGVVTLGNGSAEEGISIEYAAEADIMKIGADGSVMHSLAANKSGKVTVRLQKTSPTNGILSTMFNLQRASASLWGNNLITLTDNNLNEVITCQKVAFTKIPDVSYATEAGTQEWVFNAGIIDTSLTKG